MTRMRGLAARLAELGERLDQHRRATAHELGDALAAVPPGQWRRAERTLHATGPDPRFAVLRARAAAGPDEVDAVEAAHAVPRVGGPLVRRAARASLRRRERLVFGARAPAYPDDGVTSAGGRTAQNGETGPTPAPRG